MSLHLVSTLILTAHWLIVVGLSIRVIMRRPPVGVAVAWLAVIASVPFVGAAVYLLFGEKRLGRPHPRVRSFRSCLPARTCGRKRSTSCC